MAILHRKEEKIQVVLGRLPKNYTHEEFVEMFIKLYSKDWGKIKSAYIKQSQDKEPGTVITMPKPDLYLKQVLETYLAAKLLKPEIALKEIKAKPAAKPTSDKQDEIPIKKIKAASEKVVEEKLEATVVPNKKALPIKK